MEVKTKKLTNVGYEKKLGVISIIAMIIFIYLLYNPIVFYSDDYSFPKMRKLNMNETFTLKELIGWGKNANKKCFIILKTEGINSQKILKSNDTTVINDLLNLEFKYIDADMATVDDRIILYFEDKIVFSGGLVTNTKNGGIQDRFLGWSSVKNNTRFSEIISKFKTYYTPFLILK